ncbi:MAG: DUF4190 domain-containing protein [Micropruina sp.]|nr:DUF4190 domain-containing protein [Micropruina sp.]
MSNPYRPAPGDPLDPRPTEYAEPAGNYSQPYFGTAGPYQPTGMQAASNQPYPYYTDPHLLLPEHPQATTVLVVGILSLVLFPPLGPIAWVMGSRARREVAANPLRLRNGGSLTIGWVMGIISSVLMMLAVAGFLFFLGLIIVASS